MTTGKPQLQTRTLDQQRAAIAWELVAARAGKNFERYRNLVKGAPALIMSSGLLATCAFYAGKKQGEEKDLLQDLLRGLIERRAWPPGSGEPGFPELRRYVAGLDGHAYMRLTREAMELLKWMRQFVDAAGPDRRDT